MNTLARIILPALAFCSLCISVHAQNYTSYPGFNEDKSYVSVLQQGTKAKFIADSLGAKGEYKKYLQKQYRDRYNYLNDLFENNLVVSGETSTRYFTALLKEIVSKNPVLQGIPLRPFLYRAWWPNASTTGEGSLIFNTGLFTRMRNESEVAFVICHELAHQYLNHVNASIDQYVNTVYAEDFQKELKKIKKSAYEQNKQLDALEKNITYTSRRHGRNFEAQADSMGLIFLSRTSFDSHQALRALNLLDSIDDSQLDMEKVLRKNFSFDQFPFKDNWLKKESSFFGGPVATVQQKKESDSLRTHPDCKKRISLLEPFIQTLPKGQLNPVNGSDFIAQQQLMQYDMVEILYKKDYLSRTLYNALSMLEDKPGDPYLVVVVGETLNKLYSHQKAHTFGTVTDRPSPYVEKDYDMLLRFLDILKLDELAGLGLHFLQRYTSSLQGNPRFEAALQQSITHQL